MVQLLHTPEGVKDYYNDEFARKDALRRRIEDTFSRYGYRGIQTPSFEYFDIFNAERGSVSSRDMYKMIDRNGETLVLRPDFTPSIARCAAKYYGAESLPVRFCYEGNTFINNSSYQGRLKETTQAGIELIGDDSLAADAEVIALAVDCMKSAGLSEFQVEIGQVDFFNGLLQEAGLQEEVIEVLRDLIGNKNFFGVEERLKAESLPEDLTRAFLALPQLFGSADQVFEKARTLTKNTVALAAVDRLEQLYELLTAYEVNDYITFDLGMLGNYQYYTGIIFQGYTYGTGDYIVTGGRYDNLMVQFGKDAPSVGFGISVDTLMSAIQRQKIQEELPWDETMILYEPSELSLAIALGGLYRKNGRKVSLTEKRSLAGEYMEYAVEHRIGSILLLTGKSEAITVIQTRTGETTSVPVPGEIRRGNR